MLFDTGLDVSITSHNGVRQDDGSSAMTEDLGPVRDHFLSIFQSAVSDLSEQTGAPKTPAAPLVQAAARLANLRANGTTDVTAVDDFHSTAANLGQPQTCVTLGLQYFEAKVRGDTATADRLANELRNSTCDPRWVNTLSNYLGYFGPNGTPAKIPYVRAGAIGNKTIEIASNARIAVFADWGTGTDAARQLIVHIKELRPDILVHLGDIYYSGTARECQSNFVNLIESVFDRRQNPIPVFSLAGNHDMYSGGAGYYAMIRSLNSGALNQGASFFCLRTADASWQLLAMDTGYNDYNPFNVADVLTFVEPDEQKWHLDRLADFSGRTILLSHHQLFSAFSRIGAASPAGKPVPYNPKLLATFNLFAKLAKPISAWFWGHEHTLSIYQNGYLGLARGRCLSHGAIPVFKSQNPYKQLSGVDHLPAVQPKTRLAMDGDIYAHGFALVALASQPAETQVEYFQGARGTLSRIWRETLA
jgi:hypothetical protein